MHTIPCEGSTFGFWIPLVLADQIEKPRQEKKVFINHQMMEDDDETKIVESSEMEQDISNLMQYCENKLEENEGGQ